MIIIIKNLTLHFLTVAKKNNNSTFLLVMQQTLLILEKYFYCFSKAFGKSLEANPVAVILKATSLLSLHEKKPIEYGMVIAKK